MVSLFRDGANNVFLSCSYDETPTPGNTPVPSAPTSPIKQKPNERNRGNVAGVVMIAPDNRRIGVSTHKDRLQLIKYGKSLRYVYQNNNMNRDTVRKYIENQTIDLSDMNIYYVEVNKFSRVLNGQYLSLEKWKPQK